MSPGQHRTIRRLLWVLTVGVWVSLFIATHLPVQQLPDVAVSDKFIHFAAYFGLAAMIYVSTWVTNPRRKWTGAMILAIAMVYGVIDEVLQPFVGRHADVMDWVYDAAGAAAAVTLLGAIRWILSEGVRRGDYHLGTAPAES